MGALLAASLALVRLSRPGGPVDALLLFWLTATAHVVVVAELLSCLNALARPWAWCAASIAALAPYGVAVAVSAPARTRCLAPLAPLPVAAWRAGWRALPRLHRVLLAYLALAASIAGALNLVAALLVAPQNWDVLSYHLARVAYYLEHGNFDRYPANYWAQIVHPHGGTALLLYTFLAAGRHENATQLVQYAAYLVSVVAVYGIARRAGGRRSASLFAALVFALLTEVLMEASTAQNDLLCAAYVAVSVYFLLSYRARPYKRRLVFAGCSAGLGLAVKASVASALPSIAVVAVFAILAGGPGIREVLTRRLPTLAASFALGAIVFALPAGYVDNLRAYHHPVGPVEVRRVHSYEGTPPGKILVYGGLNLLRYGVELLSLDGLPPLPATIAAQRALRWPAQQLTHLVGVDLHDGEGAMGPLDVDKPPIAHENLSYWGILGFALIGPAAAAALLRRRTPRGARVVAIAALVFLVTQAFYGPYDHWRGRYFIAGAALAAPLAARWIERPRGRILSAWLSAIVVIGGVSGVAAVLLRQDRAIVAVPSITHTSTSVLRLGRLDQMLLNRGRPADALRTFDRIVPPGAVVGAALPPDVLEYVLFGEGLTRRIEPVSPKRLALPAGAGYLVFPEGRVARKEGDTPLGQGWFLRETR